MRGAAWILLAAFGWCAVSCASSTRAPSELGTPDQRGMTHVRSNDGGFELYFATEPEKIPLNEAFGVTLVIEMAGDGVVPELVSADAAMPHHGHGMNHLPTVTRRDDGAYEVRDMLLHMSGYWELYVDVAHQGITERAQWSIELE